MANDPVHRPMTLDEFLPLVGKRMMARCTPDEVPLTLVEASPSRTRFDADKPPFILIFRSDLDALLVDGIYVVSADGFGPDYIAITSLMTPRTRPPGYYYQAVFN